MLYFSGMHYNKLAQVGSLWRMPVPPRLARTMRPAPPLITSIEPESFLGGDTLIVSGKSLAKVAKVTFVDDSSRREIPAAFKVNEDGTLAVTVPRLNIECEHPVVILESPSGVTVTLNDSLRVIGTKERYEHDRLKATGRPQFWIAPQGTATSLEKTLIYAERDTFCKARAKGESIIFAKNGCLITKAFTNCTVYHEPFANIAQQDETMAMHPVCAIRPSFLTRPLTLNH
jgi:hypothetical protein